MTNNVDRLRQAIKKNWLRQEQGQWIYGKLGRVREGLDPEYLVKGRKNFLYVTIRNASGAQTAVPARNDAGVPYTEVIQVKIKLEYGVYVIGGRTGKADEGSSPTAPPTGVLPHAFTSHTDVPNNYTGDSLKIVRVNVGETALEFVTESAGAVDSVNGQTGVVVLDADAIDDTATTNKFATAAELTKLAGIETGADVTDAGNVSPVVSAFAAKNPPIDADSVVITDSAAADAPKRVTFTNVKDFLKTYFDTLYDLTSTAIGSLATKTTPIDADWFVISDSAAANVGKKVTGTNLKAYLKTYFDTLYGLLAGGNTWTGLNDFERNVSVEPTNTTGNAFSVLRNLVSGNAPMVAFVQDEPTHTQAAFIVQQDGSGDIVSLYDGATLVLAVKDGGKVSFGPNAAPDAIVYIEGNTTDLLHVHNTGSGTSANDFSSFYFSNPHQEWSLNLGAHGNATWLDKFYIFDNTRAAAVIVVELDGTVIIGGLTSAVASGVLAIKAGLSSNDAAVGGVLYVSTSQVSNTGGGEDTLNSYPVPANTLAVNGQSLWFEASGRTAATPGTKTIRVSFGGVNVVSVGSAFGGLAVDWYVRGRIVRTGAATQKAYGHIQIGGGTSAMNYADLTSTLSGAVTIAVTGESSTPTTGDVINETFIVGFDDNNT